MKILILILLSFVDFSSCIAQDVKYGAIKIRFLDTTIKNRYKNLIIVSKLGRIIKKDTIICDSILKLPVGKYKIVVKGLNKFNKVIWKSVDIYEDKLTFLEIIVEHRKYKRKKREKSKWENCG